MALDLSVVNSKETCKGLKYDTFLIDVAKAKAGRDAKLKSIEELID